MKFKNWTVKDLEEWISSLPSSPLINPHNKIKIWGEIHVDNSEPKQQKEGDDLDNVFI